MGLTQERSSRSCGRAGRDGRAESLEADGSVEVSALQGRGCGRNHEQPVLSHPRGRGRRGGEAAQNRGQRTLCVGGDEVPGHGPARVRPQHRLLRLLQTHRHTDTASEKGPEMGQREGSTAAHLLVVLIDVPEGKALAAAPALVGLVLAVDDPVRAHLVQPLEGLAADLTAVRPRLCGEGGADASARSAKEHSPPAPQDPRGNGNETGRSAGRASTSPARDGLSPGGRAGPRTRSIHGAFGAAQTQ